MNVNENLQSAINWFAGSPLRIAVTIILALALQKISSRSITRILERVASADLALGGAHSLARQKERARTAGTVLRSTTTAIIWLITSVMVLGEFGLNLGPLVASAGILGVALGLGAQTIVRDVLSGIFMLVEDQYGVGDLINVLDVEGVVEFVGLRITTVRDKKGTLWYLRNGEIMKIGNKSQKKR